jgi:8-oxo-dGTP pyrophosphatase MutT (NUDIX family)
MARRGDRSRRVTAPTVREFSAGGLVYRRRAGVSAVVMAARRPARGGDLQWTIPKGHVEPGETTIAAAVREVREETGLVAKIEQPLGDVTYWYARRIDAGRPVRVFKRVRFFLMRVRGGRFGDRDQEMEAVGWFSLDEAERVAAHESERALVRRARELLGSQPTPASRRGLRVR